MNETILRRKPRGPIIDSRKPIHVHHKEREDYFKKLKGKPPTIKKEIADLETQIAVLKKECINPGQTDLHKRFMCCKYCALNRRSYLDLIDQIIKLEREVVDINSNTEENEYYLNTYELLSLYDQPNTVTAKATPGSNSVEAETVFDTRTGPPMRKSNILKEYLDITGKEQFIEKVHTSEFDVCPTCDTLRIYDPVCGTLICEGCGIAIHDGFLSSKCSFKDIQTMESSKQFEYKRVGHCKYWILKIQGKEPADIPKEVYTGIEKEIAKERIKNRETITPTKVRVWLKKIGHSKHYDHIVLITRHIGGTKSIDIPQDREEKLINLFKEVEEIFEIVKPSYMSNFMSFPYTLYKICELLEWDEYLPWFKLLTRDERLLKQDDVWKKICKGLKWEFHPTTNG